MALPADQQGDDDLTGDAPASERARRQTSAGSPQTPRAPVTGRSTPTTSRPGERTQRHTRDLDRTRPAGRTSLFSGPPLLPSLSATHRGRNPKGVSRFSLLASLGFGSRPQPVTDEAVWRPAMMLAGICALVILAAYALVGRHIGQATFTRHALLALAVALACEVLLATAALTFASNDTGRAIALGSGGLAALLTTVFIVFGSRPALVVTVLCVVLIGMTARQSLHPVAEGTVHITALPGGRHRTLEPGLAILLPGERLMAVLSTRPAAFQTLPERATVASGLAGEAALWVRYALMPERAASAIATTRDWERVMRRRATATLREELASFIAEDVAGGDLVTEQARLLVSQPGDSGTQASEGAAAELRARIAARLRRESAAQGVNVLTVELRQVLLSAAVWDAWRRAPSAEQLSSRGEDDAHHAIAEPATPRPTAVLPSLPVAPALATAPAEPPTQAARDTSAPAAGVRAYLSGMQQRLGGLAEGWRRLIGQRRTEADQPEAFWPAPDSPAPGGPNVPRRSPDSPEQGNSDVPQPGEHSLSARTLAAMYEAIEEQRITDPDTIRHVADALGQYVPSPDDDNRNGFDPYAAAAEIQQLLAQQSALPSSDAPATAANREPPAATDAQAHPSQRPPRPPDDDNVLRGG